MARVAVHFLVPHFEDKSLGEGKLHPPFRWIRLQGELEQLFEGWSILSESVRGAWIEPSTGRRVEDISTEYVVDVDESRLQELRDLMRQVAADFCQQVIRVVIRGEVEYIGRATP